jgi:hypothetical protein
MDTVKIDTRGGSIRVEVADNVGPLMAFRSHGPAQRCLDSYSDVAPDRVSDGVTILTDLDGQGDFHVAFITYPRKVRR